MSYRGLPIYDSSAIITRRELESVRRIGLRRENNLNKQPSKTDEWTKEQSSSSNKTYSLKGNLLTCKEYIFTSIYVLIFKFYHLLRLKLVSLMSTEPKVKELTEDTHNREDYADNLDRRLDNSYDHTNNDSESDTYSDKDSSLIILGDTRKKTNIFSSLLEEDDDNDIQTNQDQYGTSLGLGISSHYHNPSGNFKGLYNPEKTANFQLDLLSADEVHDDVEYDRVVLKHYLPNKPVSALNYSIIDTLLSSFHIDKISDRYAKERQKVQDLFKQQREKEKAGILPLSKDQLSSVLNIWKSKSNPLVVSNFQIDIFGRDLKTLDDGQWLNDNIIDYYFNLITSGNDKVYGWTTHFFTTLQSKGYQGVARWAKRRKIDVTTKNIVLVPINIMGTHWALAVVNNSEKSFGYYDSLTSKGNRRALEIIRDYMINEGKRLNSAVDFQSYEMFSNIKTPQQKNGYDCGVFTCTCAKYISNSMPLNYSQNDMKVIRRRMAYEVIHKQLILSI